ncbi:MAG: transposase [Candidatus Omnitrophota bacterium]|jgi:putative transposase
MPRTARTTIQNGCYHIITRGNQKQSVFLEPYDYEKYLNFLTKYKKKFKFKLYCFCLMPNHIHLIIELNNPSILNRIMRGLNLSYSQYFNFKYKKVGHLWQDRFKSKIIEKDAYLLECINYVESNPIRASLVSHINEYRWSSYNLKRTNANNELIDTIFSL